jgi:multidrug efflux pump subunit AcrA (membrane-fusion protein)
MVKAYEIAHRAMRFTCRFGGMLGIALGVIVTAAHADDAPFVKLAPVTAGASQLERVFFGKVVARATVDLAFQVSGQIVELSLDEGAAVSKGSALARMDLEPFELALDVA